MVYRPRTFVAVPSANDRFPTLPPSSSNSSSSFAEQQRLRRRTEFVRDWSASAGPERLPSIRTLVGDLSNSYTAPEPIRILFVTPCAVGSYRQGLTKEAQLGLIDDGFGYCE